MRGGQHGPRAVTISPQLFPERRQVVEPADVAKRRHPLDAHVAVVQIPLEPEEVDFEQAPAVPDGGPVPLVHHPAEASGGGLHHDGVDAVGGEELLRRNREVERRDADGPSTLRPPFHPRRHLLRPLPRRCLGLRTCVVWRKC